MRISSLGSQKIVYTGSSSVTVVSASKAASTAASTSTTTAAPTPTPTSESFLLLTPIENVFYSDNTLFEFELETADECCEYCSETDGCVLYSLYVSASEGVSRCLLESAEGNATTYDPVDGRTVVSAFLTNPNTPVPTSAPTCAAQGEYCGNAWGTCCPDGSYCQPWNE
jgi:hypothetical protein